MSTPVLFQYLGMIWMRYTFLCFHKKFQERLLLILIHFYPRPVLAFGYCHRPCLCICQCVCVYVCVCINHLLVRTITHQPFKLKSPNLKHRCKTPWLRCLLFWGVIDLELQGQIERESRILPHFELVRTITCHPFKLESPNLDKKCILVQLRCLLV